LKTTGIFYLSGILLLLISGAGVEGQAVTGVWKGKIRSTRLELKLIKNGDSLVGTSYYYESKNSYRRYTIKGYFDDATNNVVWWDDSLIENKPEGKNQGNNGQDARMAVADFNCPGDGVMKLEGESSKINNKNDGKVPLNLEKTSARIFEDEWDFVLENYTKGANNPLVIDSVAQLALGAPPSVGAEQTESSAPLALQVPVRNEPEARVQPAIKESPLQPPAPILHAVTQATPEEKFNSRAKKLQNVIPITGDSVELRFYDDGEIDGDSIAVFLNGQLIEQHIFLTDQPHTIKIPVNRLEDDNELVMVAENLGSIPPNTSLMVALVGDKRYEARLYADENTSALVRFVKEIGKKDHTP
jgi:hypothetical protein